MLISWESLDSGAGLCGPGHVLWCYRLPLWGLLWGWGNHSRTIHLFPGTYLLLFLSNSSVLAWELLNCCFAHEDLRSHLLIPLWARIFSRRNFGSWLGSMGICSFNIMLRNYPKLLALSQWGFRVSSRPLGSLEACALLIHTILTEMPVSDQSLVCSVPSSNPLTGISCCYFIN